MSLPLINGIFVRRDSAIGGSIPHDRRFCPLDCRSELFDSCSGQSRQPFEVPTDAFKLQFQPVGVPPYIPHPPVTRAAFPPAKDSFDPAPQSAQQLVDPHRRVPQFFPTAGLAQNPVGDAVLTAPLAAGFTPVSLVRHHHFLVALDHRFKLPAVMHVGGRQRDLSDQCVRFIRRDMCFVAIVRLASLHGVARIAITASFCPPWSGRDEPPATASRPPACRF